MNHDILSSVGEHRLNTLFLQAERADSRRAHLLLHGDAADPVQRLLIALNPGTYIPPQRHPLQWELQLLMFGRIRTFTFDENGHVCEILELSESTLRLVQVPAGTWHALVVLEPRTLMFEVKPGPYQRGECASWAPQEEAPDSAEMITWLSSARIGDVWRRSRAD